MSLATVLSRSQVGLQADLVRIEVHLGPGLPGVHMVGLPEAAVRESKDRVKAAILNCGYEFPVHRRLTLNLAPADIPKDGARFDLPIALGILAASDQIPRDQLDGMEAVGELSLAGELRPVRGALPASLQAGAAGHRLLLPRSNLAEAALARATGLATASHLGTLCTALHSGPLPKPDVPRPAATRPRAIHDLVDVRGQHRARRALEIAAAGSHSLLMIGPPGAGKSMLARRLPGILPPMPDGESLEVAAIASAAGAAFDPSTWGQRPYRAPHHTASAVALVGGGSLPRPGEITLAHHGVLFLDELPEFDRRVLEVLREPLESGHITISRAARQADFPARFQLAAAMNPCPCGWLGDSSGRCRCTPDQVQRYRGRVSGPLLDRLDLQLFVPRVDRRELTDPELSRPESSASVRTRTARARARQLRRQGAPNAQLAGRALERHCMLDADSRALLDGAALRLGLSARSIHRVMRVARTIADLEPSDRPAAAHVAEAIGYRHPDGTGGR